MSRSYCSYDEDWQRRKSILIRSLFHDLPILSPVTEESDDSFPPVRSYEPLEEPQRPYSPLPPLTIERVPKTNKHDEPEEHYKKLLIKIKRIYRRLFILNRNLSSDEEFFSDRSITDNDDLDDPIAINNDDNDLENPITHGINHPVNEPQETNDLNDNKDSDQSEVNDNTNSNDDDIRQSSDSNPSDGYQADSESAETVFVDVLNYTKSTNEKASNNIENKSKYESIYNTESGDDDTHNTTEEESSSNQKAGDNETSSTNTKNKSEESIVEEESSVLLTDIQETYTALLAVRKAENIIEDLEEIENQEETEEESDDKFNYNQDPKDKSPNYSDENNQEINCQEDLFAIIRDEDITDQEMLAEQINDKIIKNQGSKAKPDDVTEGSSQNSSQQEVNDDIRQDQQNRFEDLNNTRMNIIEADDGESDDSSNEEWSEGEESESLIEENSTELSITDLEDIDNAQELEVEKEEERMVMASNEFMEDDVEVVSDIGSYFRQITTAALVHVDASKDIPDKESQVYEDSPKSIILPVRQMKRSAAQAMLDRREDLVEMEQNKEPRTEATIDSNGESFNNVEEMRSKKRKSSKSTTSEITRESISEESNEFYRTSRDLADVTSSTQNGANFNISKRKTSDDLGEVLTRILNESPNNVENTRVYRKRKNLEDISVQTNGNVSWDDIRRELFVGAPKILRLCSCVDHVCQ